MDRIGSPSLPDAWDDPFSNGAATARVTGVAPRREVMPFTCAAASHVQIASRIRFVMNVGFWGWRGGCEGVSGEEEGGGSCMLRGG